MKVSEAIKALQAILEADGDLEIKLSHQELPMYVNIKSIEPELLRYANFSFKVASLFPDDFDIASTIEQISESGYQEAKGRL